MLTRTFENVYENSRKKSGVEICADILEVEKKGAKKSHIVYKANLNFKLLDKYLVRLKKSDMITSPTKENFFKTTEKGISYSIRILFLVGILLSAIMSLFMYTGSTNQSRYHTVEGIVVCFHSIGSLIFVILQVYYSPIISRARAKYVPRKPVQINLYSLRIEKQKETTKKE
jgi:predicted transcriptional regulator